MAEKCNRCICVDCVKIGCYKYTVRYAYQRCMRCIIENLPPWPECKYFQLPPDPEPVVIGEKKPDKLDKILLELEELKKALLK